MIAPNQWNRFVGSIVLTFAVWLGGCSRPPATPTVADIENAGVARVSPANRATGDVVSAAGYEFAAPVRVKAGNEFIAVESPGYACPTMADVDNDGKEDLVIGQFLNGNMKFCKNVGATGEAPVFEAAKWVMTGDERAKVPGVW